VPFKGNAPATTAILGGQIEVLFGALPPLLPHVKAGTLRPLAISSAKRSPSLPQVPTVAEQGYPGFDISLWLGFFAPKGTPASIVKRLGSELLQIAQSADLKDVMEKQGLEANALNGADLAKLVKAEIETYKTVFKAANIKME
jgi:tripartite-type tricarboxylate transporter receptor subunit TctC